MTPTTIVVAVVRSASLPSVRPAIRAYAATQMTLMCVTRLPVRTLIAFSPAHGPGYLGL